VIHVPDRELGASENGETPSPVKKKTRRGSRGGKNRRKKTGAATSGTVAAATQAPAAEPEAAREPEPPSENGDGDWGYTPMSEWGMDEST
jgi:hypothetical protein